MLSKSLRNLGRGGIGLVVGTLVAAAAASPAGAEGLRLAEYGPRAGFSVDPDQFVFGGFADWGELAPMVHLRTSADLGLGDNFLTFIINGDVTYHFKTTPDAAVSFYGGGGLAFVYVDFDAPNIPGSNIQFDTSTTDIGVNLVFGVEKDLGGYKNGSLELRIGVVDAPDIKVMAGLGFF